MIRVKCRATSEAGYLFWQDTYDTIVCIFIQVYKVFYNFHIIQRKVLYLCHSFFIEVLIDEFLHIVVRRLLTLFHKEKNPNIYNV